MSTGSNGMAEQADSGSRPPRDTTGRAQSIELTPTRKLQVLTGRTHPALAEDVAAALGVELGDPKLVDFANGELRPRFAESVRGADVFVM